MAHSKKYLIPLSLGLFLAGAVFALAIHGASFIHLMELKAVDAYFLARGPVSMAGSKVAVVSIGERTLDRQGRWPWPRTKVAKLVQAVADYQAQAIGLDMGFFEPDNRFSARAMMAVNQAARQGKPLSDQDIVINFHPDVVLARTFSHLRGRLVMGYFFHMTADKVAHLSPEEIKQRRRSLDRFAYPAVRFRSREAMAAPFLTAVAPEATQPILLEASKAAGYFDILPDSDGVMRRLPLVIKCGSRYFPPLGYRTLAAYLGSPLPVLDVYDTGLADIKLGDRRILVDPKGRMLINLRGGPGTVKVFEATDLMEKKLPAGALKGKAVLLGISAMGLFDIKSTVFSPVHPGVEVQAQAMDNILKGDFLVKPLWAGVFGLCVIVIMGILGTIYMGIMRPLWGGVACAITAFIYVLIVYNLFLLGYVVNTIYPLLALLASGAGVGLYRNLTEEKEKRWLRDAFDHYLNPAVIDRLAANPGQLNMGGEKKELSVLFSDIRGFTSIAEKMDPEKLAKQLGIYLERMTETVFEQEGVLDKFIGDAVMAFYGAPMEQPDHAKRACRTALAMVQASLDLDKTWEEMGLPPLRLGVGVNTGSMIVGNLGCVLRMDYTVVGDSVNLASRLEGLTRTLGVDILVGHETRDQCAEEFFFRPLALVKVKGKEELVEVYQLVSPREGHEPPPMLEVAQQAFDAVKNGDLAASLRLNQEILRRFPGDHPATWAIRHLKNLLGRDDPVKFS
ncbi:MAG: adenylate/guanylate cyclase domain-containing protein [Desulfarculus sp.]|nr:adenylate/guanylate cyclase domain-containing protein [Pseudomonadota bacterium]MBV1717343.1 adenylate/guanylate cyclase domain-containing protein [Desulfarculus sp.]MBU4575095.1 adenylate/guanylate cyclase domain-containing protein [Pseudomonadota bacterium]MBU4596930.1 adenylate/guanylate cyclase domain-containing protein [Pseudomonadota bacterium]MBV1736947.1 adenylate/guanylate cyclase domain-containing protein [Desulfarculus sp.]